MSDSCLFCKIIRGEIPSTKLYEDDDLIAFLDIQPEAPVHFLVAPKKHIANLFEVQIEDAALLGKLVFTAQELAVTAGMGKKGGRFIFNCKSDGNQSVDHIHMHVLGGRALAWPPG